MKKWLLALLCFACALPVLAQQTLTPNVGFQIPAYQQVNWQVPIDFNFNVLDTLLGGSRTLQTGTTTPNLGALNTNYVTANTGGEAVTNFIGGYPGETIRVICGTGDDFTTISAGTNIDLGGSWGCPSSGAISLTLIGSVWVETGRQASTGGGGTGCAGGVTLITAASYTPLSGDCGKTVSMMNAAASTLTLPNPPLSSTFWVTTESAGAGGLTVERNGLLLDGTSSDLTLTQNQGILIYTDGTNYFTVRGASSTSGTICGTITNGQVAFGDVPPNCVTGSNLFTYLSGVVQIGAPNATTTPLVLRSVSGAQTASVLDINNGSSQSNTNLGDVTIRGYGLGGWGASGTALLALVPDSQSSSANALLIGNGTALTAGFNSYITQLVTDNGEASFQLVDAVHSQSVEWAIGGLISGARVNVVGPITFNSTGSPATYTFNSGGPVVFNNGMVTEWISSSGSGAGVASIWSTPGSLLQLNSLAASVDDSGNLTVASCTGCGDGGSISFPQTVGGTTNSGGVPYFSSTTQLSSSAALPAGDFVLGGGAGSAPTASFSVVTVAKGGTGTGSTLTGIMRGNASAFTASEISGDGTTSGSNALTVTHVNGISYSATAAAHSVEVVTTANTTATAKVIPDCVDTGGNHINYTQSTDLWSCGSSSSGGGSPAFSALTGATNTSAAMIVGTGASLTVSGSGTINATSLNSNTFANPGAIGGGTAAAGTFTTLIANTSLVINGGTALTTTSQSGTGNLCLVTSCTMITPTLGAATATTINKVTITQPASAATLTILNGKTVTLNNSLTFAGADSTTMTFPSSSATVTQTVASGTAALGTSAIGSGACATVVTATATGTATTDNVAADFNADPTSTTGYSPVTTGSLQIYKYPTANTVNFKVCNLTSSSITPGAVTLNWRVTR